MLKNRIPLWIRGGKTLDIPAKSFGKSLENNQPIHRHTHPSQIITQNNHSFIHSLTHTLEGRANSALKRVVPIIHIVYKNNYIHILIFN